MTWPRPNNTKRRDDVRCLLFNFRAMDVITVVATVIHVGKSCTFNMSLPFQEFISLEVAGTDPCLWNGRDSVSLKSGA